jgi:hypothetical protein
MERGCYFLRTPPPPPELREPPEELLDAPELREAPLDFPDE